MKRKVGLVLLLMLLCIGNIFSQTVKVTGTVTDEKKSPLPGVSVSVKGTTRGTATDINGVYYLDVEKGKTVVFSFVGMITQEVVYTGQKTLNVVLKKERVQVEEVVVTAMGMTKKKKALGYAAQDVKADKLVDAGNSDFSTALQGKISGVQITSSSGMPGASSNITIRGVRSFTGNNSPLYVIDGMPVESGYYFNADADDGVVGADMANRAIDIDPNDIESINVLKGQAASAIYGIRASNGVIIITTKSGKNIKDGKVRVSFTTNYSFEKVGKTPDVQTTYAQGYGGGFNPFASMSWGPKIEDLPDDPNYGGNVANDYTNGGTSLHPGKYYSPQHAMAGLDPWQTPRVYNNIDGFFDTGHTFTNSFNVSSGSEKGSISLGLGNSNQEGIVPTTSMDRYTLKFNADRKLGEQWKVAFHGNYTENDINKASGGNDGLVATVFPAPSNYDLNGLPSHIPGVPEKQIRYRSRTFDNPYWALEKNKFYEKTNRFFGNFQVEFKPELGWGDDKSMLFKYQFGTDFYSSNYEEIFSYGHKDGQGSISNYGVTTTIYNSLLTANYTMKLMEDWDLAVLVGNEISIEKNKEYTEDGSQFNFPGWDHIANAITLSSDEQKWNERTFGLFINAALDYKSMLFINLTGRNDIVSSMPRNNRSFFYYSGSVGWVITELDALKANETLSFAKLRASYAEVGQAGRYKDNYYYTPTYSSSWWGEPVITYPVGGVNAFAPYWRIFDKNLKPQNTISYEFGADLRFFNNLIGLDYTFSRQNVKDQIFPVPLAGSTGITEQIMNGGKIHTNSHEVVLTINPIRRPDMDWTMNFNFTKIDNYVDELAPGVESIFLGGFTTPQVRAGIGDKFPVIYGDSFKRDDQGRILVDEDPNSWRYGMPMTGAPGVIGNCAPDFNLGFYTKFTYKDFSISTTWDWKAGGEMYSGMYGLQDLYGMSTRTEDRTPYIYPGFKADGTPNDIERGGPDDPAAYIDLYAGGLDVDEHYIRENDFIKIREIALRYKLPKIHGVSSSITAYARNLLVWTKLDDYDPEAYQGNTNMAGCFERFTVPQTESYGLTLNINF